MSGPPILLALLHAARRRAALDTLAVGLPAAIVAAALAWRLAPFAVFPAALVGAGALAILAWRRAAKLDSRWLTARLDAQAPALEDSSELLWRDPETLGSLAALQRRRLEARIAEAPPLDPSPPWSRRALAASWSAGALLLAAVLLLWPSTPQRGAPNEVAPGVVAEAPRILSTQVRVTPPAYTGLKPSAQEALDLRAPAGSRVAWSISFAPQPASAALVFADGTRAALRQDGNRWSASRTLDRSTLYRIEATGAERQRLHRLEATADAPPVVTTIAPKERLVTAAPGQTTFTSVFEASDDYGLDAMAILKITVAGGEGEQISVGGREAPVRGTGDAKRKRWTIPLDLAREGLEPGGDLIVQLIVRDNRRPAPQIVEGPSIILRRPSEQELSDALNGMLAPVMPAFFRSQRQIILDAEALVRERERLSADDFFQRSNGLGADQAALRLRYGQFLGEEAEGGPPPPPTADPLPTADAALPTADAPAPPKPEHFAGDGHDHAPEDFRADGVYSPREAAQEFGHVHDEGDAATLFDPATRSTLAQALDAMWGSERELRQSRPERALPYARKALEALKQAQQAQRIYLARVGPRLPPVDLSRRLSGKREGINPAGPPPLAAPPASAEALEAWRALEDRPGAPALQLDTLEGWALANREQLPDALGLLAALDALRLDPDCSECRARLRAALWPALDAPSSPHRRDGPDARGQRYLEALR